LNSSAAFITMKAGLVIRSWALSRRYTEASDTKIADHLPDLFVLCIRKHRRGTGAAECGVPSSCHIAFGSFDPTYATSFCTSRSIESRRSPVSSSGLSPVVLPAIVDGFKAGQP
jgi:hypothetical protein